MVIKEIDLLEDDIKEETDLLVVDTKEIAHLEGTKVENVHLEVTKETDQVKEILFEVDIKEVDLQKEVLSIVHEAGPIHSVA